MTEDAFLSHKVPLRFISEPVALNVQARLLLASNLVMKHFQQENYYVYFLKNIYHNMIGRDPVCSLRHT